MMSSTFGRLFRVTTFGESHGGGVGCVIDGCPPGFRIDLNLVQKQLERRRPGQSHLTTPRNEADTVECLSGLENGTTLGTPIMLLVRNQDAKSEHYSDLQQVYRPSHADFTYEKKYGRRSASGGGRASARETIGRVAAGAVAEQILQAALPDFSAVAWVDSVKDITSQVDMETVSRALVDQSVVRCPDARASSMMEQLIVATKANGDSVGGVVKCVVRGCPVGLGEPVFDKLEAQLAHAMLSLPATKGFDIGTGFASTLLYGSQHNDEFVMRDGKVRTATNHSGGVQGGISNGESIYMRVGFKPVATIFKDQRSVRASDQSEIKFKPAAGRHDPCVLPRAVPMVEAMAILTIMDLWLIQRTRCYDNQ
jgi:chorismate synthase